jgi:hypothetical protein
MEQFKASEEGWRKIERSAENPAADYSRAVCELRDRVAALEAASDRVLVRSQTGEYLRAGTPVYLAAPAAAVPSDEELWELQLKVKSQLRPHIGWQVWSPESEPLIAAHRALYDYGYQQGLAAGRAEQGSSSQGILDDSTPEPDPEPSDFQTLHGIALGMVDSLGRSFHVLPEILDTLRRAIREPMAEQQAAAEPTHPQYFSSHHAIAGKIWGTLGEIWGTLPDAPEPNQATAGDGGLVKTVLDAMGEGTEVEARKAICKVAAWARAHDLNGMSPAAMTWEGVARWLEQEANR